METLKSNTNDAPLVNGTVVEPVDHKVRPKRKRRKFSAKEKQDIINEYDNIIEAGGKGKFLRANGLYSSNILSWRKQLNNNGSLENNKPGRRPKSEIERENELLKADLERSKTELYHAQAIIDAQKKIANLYKIRD